MIWDDYSAPRVGQGTLGGEFVLADRTRTQERIVDWLCSSDTNGPQMLQIRGPTIQEILDFVAASVRSLSPDKRDRLLSSVFALEQKIACECLSRTSRDHAAIAATDDVVPNIWQASRTTGCRGILAQAIGKNGGVVNPNVETIELEPTDHKTRIRLVAGIGFETDRAIALCEQNKFDYETIRRAIFIR